MNVLLLLLIVCTCVVTFCMKTAPKLADKMEEKTSDEKPPHDQHCGVESVRTPLYFVFHHANAILNLMRFFLAQSAKSYQLY